MGYLPAALRNYLVRLGWSHGDDEVMSLDDMIRWFEIDDINKGAARFDIQKLEALNGIHMRQMDDAALLEALVSTLPYLENGKPIADRLDQQKKAQLLQAMPGLKERAKTLVELADGAAFLFAERPLPLDEKAAAVLGEPARAILKGAKDRTREDGGRLDGCLGRSRDPRICRPERSEAWRCRTAVARSAYRKKHLAGRFRCAGRPWPRGKPGPHRRSNRLARFGPPE